jgi:hypothetical protein
MGDWVTRIEEPAHSSVALMCQWADKAVAHTRLLKKAHLRRWRARAALRRTDQVRLAPAPILRMGTRRAALHLDLFEQPGGKRVLQHPAKASDNSEHFAGDRVT